MLDIYACRMQDHGLGLGRPGSSAGQRPGSAAPSAFLDRLQADLEGRKLRLQAWNTCQLPHSDVPCMQVPCRVARQPKAACTYCHVRIATRV
jgi:hypothetical protein